MPPTNTTSEVSLIARILLTSAITAALVLSSSPAQASESTGDLDISDPSSVLSAIAPDILLETSESSYGPLNPSSFGRGDIPVVPRLDRDYTPGADPTVRIRIDNIGPEKDKTAELSIKPDFVDSPITQANELAAATSHNGDTALYVQPIVDGLRLTAAISSPSADASFSYAFDLPDGTAAHSTGDGGFVLIAPGSVPQEQPTYLGSIKAPWALDATGLALPTWYEWEGDTLTQRVDLTRATAYPVIADPTWYYGHLVSFFTDEFSPSDVWTELHRCFNCSFPIGGAPSNFPAVGGVLTLDASPFTCIVSVPAPVEMIEKFINPGLMRFRFEALPGHFDGEGSRVGFSFYNASWESDNLQLEVLASVLVDNGPIVNAANRAVAESKWNDFGSALLLNMSLHG